MLALRKGFGVASRLPLRRGQTRGFGLGRSHAVGFGAGRRGAFALGGGGCSFGLGLGCGHAFGLRCGKTPGLGLRRKLALGGSRLLGPGHRPVFGISLSRSSAPGIGSSHPLGFGLCLSFAFDFGPLCGRSLGSGGIASELPRGFGRAVRNRAPPHPL